MRLGYILLAIAAALIALGLGKTFAQEATQARRHSEMLYPVVRVDSGPLKGSGTIIYSATRAGEIQTYVLTNWHVIESSIEIGKEWNPKKQEEVDKETRRTVEVFTFQYNELSRNIGSLGKRADIMAYDRKADVALLRLTDREGALPYVAALLPEGEALHIFDPVWAVGAGLGHPPFATEGVIGHLDDEIDGYRYVFTTAPMIFGNSGGALFRYSAERSRHELIGIPARVRAGFFLVVTHMAFSVPIETIREFLRVECYGFILGDAQERASCSPP